MSGTYRPRKKFGCASRFQEKAEFSFIADEIETSSGGWGGGVEKGVCTIGACMRYEIKLSFAQREQDFAFVASSLAWPEIICVSDSCSRLHPEHNQRNADTKYPKHLEIFFKSIFRYSRRWP